MSFYMILVLFQSHHKSRSIQKGSQRKSVTRSCDGGASYSRVSRVQHADHSKPTTVPLKRASRTTDKLQPLFGEPRVSQDNVNFSVSPGVTENDTPKKLATRASALTLESEDSEHQKYLAPKQQSDNGGDQFLPPIK